MLLYTDPKISAMTLEIISEGAVSFYKIQFIATETSHTKIRIFLPVQITWCRHSLCRPQTMSLG